MLASPILQNATVFVNNQTVPSHNITDNPDFPMYQMVYAVMIAVILGTSLLRGLAFTKVCRVNMSLISVNPKSS